MNAEGPLHRFDFEGRSVAYRVAGKGAPLVLVHGTPFSMHVWHRIAPLLARHRTVYRFDLLGYGASAKVEGADVSLGVQNRVLAALLNHWGIERPDVVAHDYGGATALRAHLLDGRDYRTLTLIDPVILRPQGSPLVRHVGAFGAEPFAGLPAYVHEAILRAYLDTASVRTLGDEELQPYLEPWRGEEGQAAFYRQIAQMDEAYTMAVEPMLDAVRCPVRILWGEDDRWLQAEQGVRLAAAIPGATLQPVSRAGHLVQEDAPEAIVAAVLPLLLGSERSAAAA
ncbi:alpha/beta fold hydrolase [Marinivivus vitaminiproducens]|uniref:alpha/beta fold hydrolase n=1 Tax=Marinivivus vitaminiproducens TaxID=3035935 RepID=UPI00279CA245|nr:alpha/beta hydrolase [Geminicoccaceae bacterium SCSIO 64248]